MKNYLDIVWGQYIYYCETRLILSLQKNRSFEYSGRKRLIEKTAHGKEYHIRADLLDVKITAVPAKTRQAILPRCGPAYAQTLLLHQFPAHSRTAHNQEDERTELICNTDQPRNSCFRFPLYWFCFLFTVLCYLLATNQKSIIVCISMLEGSLIIQDISRTYILICST